MGLSGSVLPSAVRWLAGVVQRVAFWTAIVLPLVWLVVVVIAPAVLADLWVLGLLLGLNAAALFLGHGYRRSAGDPLDG